MCTSGTPTVLTWHYMALSSMPFQADKTGDAQTYDTQTNGTIHTDAQSYCPVHADRGREHKGGTEEGPRRLWMRQCFTLSGVCRALKLQCVISIK